VGGGVGWPGAGVGVSGVGGVGGAGVPQLPAPELPGLQEPLVQTQDPQHSVAVAHGFHAFLQSASAYVAKRSTPTRRIVCVMD
jgi:hypothetical protein